MCVMGLHDVRYRSEVTDECCLEVDFNIRKGGLRRLASALRFQESLRQKHITAQRKWSNGPPGYPWVDTRRENDE